MRNRAEFVVASFVASGRFIPIAAEGPHQRNVCFRDANQCSRVNNMGAKLPMANAKLGRKRISMANWIDGRNSEFVRHYPSVCRLELASRLGLASALGHRGWGAGDRAIFSRRHSC
jgi:hypothetical protein